MLCRISKYLEPLKKALKERGIGASYYKDNVDMNADTVKLLTFHSAKGLEFPIVYILRADRGIVPLGKRKDINSTKELRERKLFYVAMTRAMDRLIITCSHSKPSPFLRYLDKNLVEIKYVDGM